ncbi:MULTISPECIES: diacylglycerol kinase [unclassified Pseudoalteromonas]|uniref:Diacylglycerol kinase n=1 Tax=Pseudoalteromonas sp. SD03 TaxID=3231719 RepID=A0AB39AUV4_9GAMM
MAIKALADRISTEINVPSDQAKDIRSAAVTLLLVIMMIILYTFKGYLTVKRLNTAFIVNKLIVMLCF